jgi:hypothetical protein
VASAPRISVLDVQDKLLSGASLLLVCAYPKEEKFQKHHLEQAISLTDFEARFPTLGKEVEVVFY